ncbi:hypothetical protein M404DRAFT_36356 [Pisolithus tinctorius Marx 270]|uniref:Uncharacterized protein n=1 Tax=Pisolithus tinctorius Marx 270 TaxID=870435 RepID=A0A0C3NC44_PISTI|nr:hypothetical protein M404DRAFT_36356 [Pisolithus tinctorius Marx 270]
MSSQHENTTPQPTPGHSCNYSQVVDDALVVLTNDLTDTKHEKAAEKAHQQEEAEKKEGHRVATEGWRRYLEGDVTKKACVRPHGLCEQKLCTQIMRQQQPFGIKNLPRNISSSDSPLLLQHLALRLSQLSATTMQAYSVNDVCPVFSMRDQATTALAAALGHVWDLIEGAPQPEERLETIYAWVEDWDKTWASIHSWWKYVDDNRISVPKVHDECMHNYTKESAMCQSLLVPGAIAITNLCRPVEQRRIHINDIFEDYQERVELRVQLEVERLTREPSMLMRRQAAMAVGEGQGHMPSDTEAGESSSGTGQQVRQQTEGTGKGKGKEKATDEVDELENNEGKHPLNPDPSKTVCKGLPGELCEQCRQAKQKCSWSLRVGRKRKNAGSGEMAAGPSHKWTKSVTVAMTTETPVTTGLKLWIPARKPPPRQNSEPPPKHPTPRASSHLSSDMPPPPLTPPLMDNPGDLGDSGLFGRPTGLLDNPPAPVISMQDKSKGPPVANLSESTTHKALAECIRLLEGRADDKEFELTQIHQMLGLLVTRVERQIGAVQG